MNRLSFVAIAIVALSANAVSAATFQEWVRKWESGSFEGNYSQTTPLGTATGAYQLPFAALKEAGYVSGGALPAYGAGEWPGVTWTGKNGINSRADFLASKTAQDDAFLSNTNMNWSYIQNMVPLGKKVNGIEFTKEGALSAAHMMGMGGFEKWSKCGFQSSCLIPEHAEANKMTLDEFQAHLMKRVAEGGGMDPGDIVVGEGSGNSGGGNKEASEIPSAYLMPVAPASGVSAAPLMPGSLTKLGG